VTADELWDKGAAALREQLAPATWTMWFHGVRPVSYTGERLVLGVPNSLAADRIRSSYAGMLTDAIRDSTGETVRVDLLVATDAREPSQSVSLDADFAFDAPEPLLHPGDDPLRSGPTSPTRRCRATAPGPPER
jgi:chromosomal replication initiation ATPase DnaA